MLGRNVATGLQQDLNCRLRTGLAPRPIRPTNAYSQGSNEARPACPAHATADSRGLGKPCRIPFREKRNDRGPRAANSPMNFSRRSPLTADAKIYLRSEMPHSITKDALLVAQLCAANLNQTQLAVCEIHQAYCHSPPWNLHRVCAQDRLCDDTQYRARKTLIFFLRLFISDHSQALGHSQIVRWSPSHRHSLCVVASG